jgi:predicted enzyme related to lactoylglutathione lyase
MEGQLVHFELPAEDNSRAKSFWSSLFGWKFQEFEGPTEYSMLDGNEPGGAIYPSQSGEKGPVIYFGTGDIDRTIAQVRELGGSAEDKQPIPAIGWFARCVDTEGNPFSLFQPDDSVPAPGES